MSANQSSPSAGRWQVPTLTVAFFGPVIAAWVMVVMGWYPEATTNNGQLVDPPERVEASNWSSKDGSDFQPSWFLGRWTVLLAVNGDCDDACLNLLDKVGRVRLALDKDRTRVDVLLAQPPQAAPPTQEIPYRVRVPRDRLQELINAGAGDSTSRAVHIVDTDGYRMMTYSMPLEASHLVEDLEQLLQNSDADAERLQRSLQRER